MRKITAIRKLECTKIRHRRLLHVTSCALGRGSPVLSSAVAILTFRYLGNALNAGDVFAVVTTFQSMRLPLIMAPLTLSAIENARVSLHRLQSFLVRPEVSKRNLVPAPAPSPAPSQQGHQPPPSTTSTLMGSPGPSSDSGSVGDAVVVQVSSASFGYSAAPALPASLSLALPPATATAPNCGQHDVLHDVSLKVKRGTLTAIVGSVGSGKSTLIHGLLGELQPRTGSAQLAVVPTDTGYVPHPTRHMQCSTSASLIAPPYRVPLYSRVFSRSRLNHVR